MSAIENFIKSASRLPAPPALVMEIIKLCNDPDTDIAEVVDLFQTNATLSARLLKLANSVFYGLRGEVTSVYRATVLLGMKTIRSLAVTVWTHSISSEFQDEELQKQLSTLFLHSAAVAVIGQEVARKIQPAMQDDVFLSGLLHDFGRLAMLCENIERYENGLLDLIGENRDDLFLAELNSFGFNHADLGGALAQKWGFPQFLVDSAKNHHNHRLKLTETPIEALVFLGDQLANSVLENIAPSVRPKDVDPAIWELIDLRTHPQQDEFLDACQEKLKHLLASMG